MHNVSMSLCPEEAANPVVTHPLHWRRFAALVQLILFCNYFSAPGENFLLESHITISKKKKKTLTNGNDEVRVELLLLSWDIMS